MQNNQNVLRVKHLSFSTLQSLLNQYLLKLEIVDVNKTIPGSYWGESEAGLIGNCIFVRADTPIHSLLHETCHYICMDPERRVHLDTNAGGDYDEENAVCYLQILLADLLPEMTSRRMMQDMDSWGYSFRLGSAQEWFKTDAEDAINWLQNHKIINNDNSPTFCSRT